MKTAPRTIPQCDKLLTVTHNRPPAPPDTGRVSHRFSTVDKSSPTAKARQKKYNGREHKQAGVRFTADIAAGRGNCWRCGRHIPPGTKRGIGGWIVGHDDHDINIIRGPECETCNRKAAQRKGGRVALANRGQRPRPRRTPGVTPLHW